MFASPADLIMLSIVAGTIATTITHTPLTRPIRHRMIGWPLMLGELASCPYCMGHWIALVLSAYVGGTVEAVLLNAAVITGGAAIFSGILLKLTLFREDELEELRDLIAEAKEELSNR